MKIYDNHIPEPVRLELIKSSEYHSLPRSTFKFWDLKDFNSPTDPIQTALHHIWKDNVDPNTFPNGAIEYWILLDKVVNGKHKQGPGIWHPDVYEPDTKTQDKWESGIMGSVFYPYVDCVGGFFEICDNKTKLSHDEYFKYICGLDESTEVERVKAKTNRAIFFEPHRIHRGSRIHEGFRECLVSTVWENKPLTFNG
tara:strand:+ start:168 stop:758 length:591 start_codon:yes stop_codon:yes gene_type:complete